MATLTLPRSTTHPRRRVSRSTARPARRPAGSSAAASPETPGRIDGFIILLYALFALGAFAFIGACYAILNSGAGG